MLWNDIKYIFNIVSMYSDAEDSDTNSYDRAMEKPKVKASKLKSTYDEVDDADVSDDEDTTVASFDGGGDEENEFEEGNDANEDEMLDDAEDDDVIPNHDEDEDDDDDDDEDRYKQGEDSEEEDEDEKPKTSSKKKTSTPPKKITTPISFDDDDEEEEYEENYLQKFDQDLNKNYIHDYHPECLNHNSDEIQKLSIVVRDANNIIIDPLHKTLPYLTKYEKARVLGQRAKQIEIGAKPFIKVPENIIEAHIIAELELKEKKIPFIIKRPIPGGKFEYWNLKDLEMIHF